jgi:hypothetical protein
MIKHVLVALVGFILAACSQTAPVTPPTATLQQPTRVASLAPTIAAIPTPRWIETEVDNIDVGMWLPVGWEADTTNGLTLVEHLSSIQRGIPVTGIIVYVFVPDLSSILSGDEQPENLAHAALDNVTHSPAHTGDAIVSEAVGFVWDRHHASYYLYSNEDGVCGIVLAVALNASQIVVVNVTAPTEESHRMRDMLPQILGDMELNETQFSESFISSLPDPLMFPM